MSYSASKRRIAKNAILLYFRTLLLLVIGVFTSRITLQALGVDNYGIVNVVSGFVVMFSLISAGLTSSCQRFITFEMGKPDGNIREVFSSSVYIHLSLGFIILLIAETFGLYFVNHKLNLPSTQYYAIQWVFQCSVIQFLLSIVNIPYNAIIIANERFNVFAYISILEGMLKLCTVIVLLYFPGDKLIIYALLGLASSIIVRLTYQIYTRCKFRKDVRLKRKINKFLVKKIFAFAGWSFIGNTAAICSNQGVNILLNIFFGVVVNAARGISVMIENIITNFVNNFTAALNPQITKAYASTEYEQMHALVEMGVRTTFMLMLIIIIPVEFAATQLLDIWFVTVPDYTVIFVRLTLIIAFISAMGAPFLTVVLATGKIRNYQLIVGLITFLNFPGSYILLKYGLSPVYVYYLAIVNICITFIIRLFFVWHHVSLDFWRYYKLSIRKLIPTAVVCSIASYGIYHMVLPIDNLFKLALFGLLSAIASCLIIYGMGLNDSERMKIKGAIVAKLHHD